MKTNILKIGLHAKKAASLLAILSTNQKNKILKSMAQQLLMDEKNILKANEKDVAAAKKRKISPALQDRLLLNSQRLQSIAKGMEAVAALNDPVGRVLEVLNRPNGLEILKIRVPIGVVAVIYESRPNVTADVAALCFKSGNAVILRGGSDALHSNQAMHKALQRGAENAGAPKNIIQLITSTDHAVIKKIVQMVGIVDLVMPRGGEKLIEMVSKNAHIPVIKHYKGLCHIYVDETANWEMANRIIENAKCQRPGVCNAAEVVLVHEKVAKTFLPLLAETLFAKNVELRGDKAARKIVPKMKAAKSSDWDTEYLDLILAIKIVKNISEAIQHINEHGSHHSDAIISENRDNAQRFTKEIDSAAVYVNASTRFTDGAEFGMGAEIGISTDKIHARGPMGLNELTTYKYVILGSGQVR